MKTSDITNELTTKTLTRLAQENLPARASFVIALNLKNIGEVVKLFNEKRDATVTKYAAKDSEGKVIHPQNGGEADPTRVTIEDTAAFTKELGDLLDVETEVTITKLKPEQLGDAKLTPAEMLSILWMINGD